MRDLKVIVLALIGLIQVGIVLANRKVLTGGTIIAYDEDTRLPKVVRAGALVVKDDRIDQILEEISPNATWPHGTDVIDCKDKIITPGFVDTHRHGWQTVFKTMASNTTLSEYAVRYGAPTSQQLFSPDDVYISQKVGILEALNAGTTTILDHAHHTWTREHAVAGYNASIDSGGRIYFAYAIQNFPGFSIQEHLNHWSELNSGEAQNLTKLVMAYDSFTDNPYSKDTQDTVKLAK